MAETVSYIPPPHMDKVALIRRAIAQILAWQKVYGEHQPAWLPPAGDVRWMEDAQAFLDTHTLPQPVIPAHESGVSPLDGQTFCTKDAHKDQP